MARRKFNARYAKGFFDFQLSVVRSRYIDAFHNHAAGKIPLHNLTNRLRTPLTMANSERIPDNAVMYGVRDLTICKPVTAETLASRMGIAATIKDRLQPPRDKLNFWQAMRGQAFTRMHEPFLKSKGPFLDDDI